MSELMNERNVCLGGSTKDWTNPSKNLVDRALERWSSRKMRADNTSVVIIMLDPPGPPKRDVLKTCSPQQYTLDYLAHADLDDEHTDALRTETGLSGDGSGDNFTMFDHRTNENIDLEDIPMPTSGLAIMTRAYETNAEVPYMNSFAESYNSLLNSSLEHDQSYIYNTGESDDVVAEVEDEDYDEDSGDGSNHFAAVQQQQAMTIDTYRLTKLQTRSEQQIDLYGGESSSSSSSTSSTSSHNYFAAVQQQQSTVAAHKKQINELLFQQSAAIDAYRLHHPPQTIQHYQTMSSTNYGIPCASTSNFRMPTVTAAVVTEQPLPAMETILHDLHNSTNYYAENQKVLIDPNDITIISNCSDTDESQNAVAVAVAVECLTDGNYTFQPDYEPEIEEEMSTVDLTISPATVEDLAELGKVISADDSIQINEISSSEAMDEETIVEQNEPEVSSQPELPSPVPVSPSPPKTTPAPSFEVPIERIMTRSSQAQSPRITRSTDKRAITKQSEKKRRQVALKAKIDAIIQKRGSTTNSNASVSGGSEHSVPANKFHKENISNVRKQRKQLVTETAAVTNMIRTRNASVRIPSPATVSSNAVSSQRTLRSQNTVSKDKAQQASTSTSRNTDNLSNDAATSAQANSSNKQNLSSKPNSSSSSTSSSNSISNSSNKQPKRLTDAVQIVKNDATKLKTNVQQFLTTRQLREAKLVALNNVSTIRCKMMLAKKSLAVLPSRCSNGSSFLGDVERTMITRRTRLHH